MFCQGVDVQLGVQLFTLPRSSTPSCSSHTRASRPFTVPVTDVAVTVAPIMRELQLRCRCCSRKTFLVKAYVCVFIMFTLFLLLFSSPF